MDLRARSYLAIVASLMAVLLSGCTSRDDERGGEVELVVFAASSLTEPFAELERGFEETHPGVDVQLVFAGSQVLRLQIEQGAAADLFASANEAHMRALADAGLVRQSQVFARNELALIVPRSNPAAIESFAGLAKGSRIVIGSDNVPVGIYTRQLLERARTQLGEGFVATVRSHVVSEENNVRVVRAKIEMGEADAALVYSTDAASSDRVRGLPIPKELNVRASYPIGALARSRHAAEAAQLIDYVLSPQGRQVLSRHGFVTQDPGFATEYPGFAAEDPGLAKEEE